MNKYIDTLINIKDLPKDFPVVPSLIENNEKQVAQFGKFLMSDDVNFALVSGFHGCGKSELVNFVVRQLKDDVLILHYTCFETTILDDMMLCLYEIFRSFVIQGVIRQPKIKAESFTQIINSYFNTVSNPIILIIDSFEAIVKENRAGVIDFLKHLSKFPNVKIVVLSTKFQPETFENCNCENISVLAFTQKYFEKYLKDNGVKNIGVLSNELYKISKGYYKNIAMALNVMKLRDLSLVKFLEKYSNSYMSYSEFIVREALSFVDPVSAHLFRLLTVMRIPIHINLLKSLNLYDENQVLYFIQNSILSYEGNCIYLKEQFRSVIENQIPSNVMVKLHSACIDLYNTQLPLKPDERDLLLSRQTMRNEIEYHNMFLPKRPVIAKQQPKPAAEPYPKQPEVQAKAPEPAASKPANEKQIQEETKQDKIKKISFVFDDEGMFDDIAATINSFMSESNRTAEIEKESSSMSLQQILNMAKSEEAKYNYKQVIQLYQTALTKSSDENFFMFLPVIYVRLAKAYLNLSDLYNALEYYTQAQDFYYNTSDFAKVCEMKLEMANIYYSMYKYDNADYILSELEKVDNLPNEMKIRVNLAKAKLSDNPKIEYEYCKKSVPLADLKTNKAVVSELYYRYAVSCNEQDDLRTAAQFYKKCIDLDNNPVKNPYLSPALSNLAELYDELGSTEQAIMYYNESIAIDTAQKNYNGLYVSMSHLAEIYSATNTDKAFEYYNKALEYAKQLNEPFYIVSTNLELADFCSLRRYFELAYRYLIEAKNLAKSSLTKDNSDKIDMRIEELKKRITVADLMRFQKKYGK